MVGCSVPGGAAPMTRFVAREQDGLAGDHQGGAALRAGPTLGGKCGQATSQDRLSSAHQKCSDLASAD